MRLTIPSIYAVYARQAGRQEGLNCYIGHLIGRFVV